MQEEVQREVQLGDVVCSKNGRSKGQYFVVLSQSGDYLFLANGKNRKWENPKKKKIKHLNLGSGHSNHISEKLLNGERITNKELRITTDKYDL